RRQELLAHVGGSVHQQAGLAARRLVCHQDGAAQAPVLRIVGIAGAPERRALPQPRHTAGGTATQNAHLQRHGFVSLAPSASGRCTLEKSRKKLSVVTAAKSASGTPFNSASI